MTSLVTDVLYSAGQLTKEDIPSKVESLKRKVEDIKIEILERMKSRYVDFIPQYLKLDKLNASLLSATSEYDVLYDQIEKEIKPQMSGSVADFQEMLEDLKKINALKLAVSNLVEMHKDLEAARRALDQKSYLDAAESILKFKSIFKEIKPDGKQDIKIYSALNTEFYVIKERIIYHLQEMWTKKVTISEIDGRKSYKNQISVSLNSKPTEKTVDMIQSLDLLDFLKNVLTKFGQQFLSVVCESLVSNRVKIEVGDIEESAVLTVLVMREEAESAEIFKHFTEIFQFLHTSFFHHCVTADSLNIGDHRKSETVMRRFGTILEKDFCTLLIEKCIKPAIPSHSKDLNVFHSVIDQVMDLQALLLKLEFFESEENSLTEFIRTIDTLPANKMAQDILTRARDLMKQDLHQTINTGVEESAYLNTTVPDETGDLNQMARTKSGLSKATFAFPACDISVFARNLVKLMHEVMREAQNVKSIYSLRLFHTVRNICELYCCVVPVVHKEEIANIPQQTAIHHNNCMYIAHCLLTLGVQYKLQLPLPATFVDLAQQIRQVGTEAFLAQMRRQKQQLVQLLQERDVFQNVADDTSLVNKAEKSVRQCLCQLQLLKRVWAEVLPTEVYFKAIGTLLNTCLEEIIQHIMSMEDIAAQTAAQLDSVFDILLKQAPELFKVANMDKCDSVHKYVRKWFKFIELQFILGASLREIVNRWASGKGPLATHFTTDEVKHLIRALFQNTERRAAALGKIYVAS